MWKTFANIALIVICMVAHEREIARECYETGYAKSTMWVSNPIKCQTLPNQK